MPLCDKEICHKVAFDPFRFPPLLPYLTLLSLQLQSHPMLFLVSNMIKNPHCSINLHGLELSVHLGWPEAERLQKQMVLLDLHIQFKASIKACQTDNIDDTYCYSSLAHSIKKKLTGQTFRLLEHLGYSIYQHLKQLLPDTDINIRIKKQPSIANLTGGVSFCYGDVNYAW